MEQLVVVILIIIIILAENLANSVENGEFNFPQACLAQSSSPDGGGRPPWFVWECLLFVIFTQLRLGGWVGGLQPAASIASFCKVKS